jgi:flagellar export protein FliJ
MPKFRLGRIIEIKNKLMDDKKNELEGAKDEMYAIDAGIRSLETDINNNYENMAVNSMVGSDFSVLKDYLYSLEVKKAGLLEEREGIIMKIEKIKAELFELAKEIKMFEKLESKAYQAEKKLLNRKEQKILDEIALRSKEREH